MQFAGQRTDLDLNPLGEPDNLLIKTSDDILPDPDAVLITGITPQKTLSEGITEAEFCRYFADKINRPNTIFVGFNSIRFDDEFMRHLFYRNFYDSYEWQWQDKNSRWDILDLVRMTRALRPKGIKWPFASDGKPSNQLGLLTSINKLDHSNAHDALSDVQATIAVAKLIHDIQPKLFKFLLGIRTKQAVEKFIDEHQQFIYTSGKYSSQYEKTAVVASLGKNPRGDGVLVYDLRYDPTEYNNLSIQELIDAWWRRDPAEGPVLPVKTLKFNHCPAIAPVDILKVDPEVEQRLQIDRNAVNENYKKLQALKDFPGKLTAALEQLDKKRQERFLPDEQDVDNQLYDNFFDRTDKQAMSLIRAAAPEELSELNTKLKDKRLQAMLPLYKARNFKKFLTPEESQAWDKYRQSRLMAGGTDSRLARYLARIEELKAEPKLSGQTKYLLTELELYGQSIAPEAN